LYFAYFAYLGLFSPYLALYLAAVGMSIAQIGVLMAVPQALRIVGPPVWGWLADRGSGGVSLLKFSSAMACLSALGLGLAGGSFEPFDPIEAAAQEGSGVLAARFALLFVVLASLFFFTAAQMPIVEPLAMRATGGDAGRYGRLRVWGSVGFILGVVAFGPVLDRLGMKGLPWWVAMLLGLLALASFQMSAVRSTEQPARARLSIGQRMAERGVQAFFASAFLMMFAHAALYAFFSLYLAAQGFSKTAIGLLWALGVIAEIAVFWFQRGLFERFGAPRLLDASLLAAILRFALIGLSAGWLPALVVAQLLHAVTFGVHHSASIATLQRWFEPGQQGRAQALYVTIGYGLGGSVGVLVASLVWTRVSPDAVFMVSAVAAAAGWLALRGVPRTSGA
jgi:PPP family 3-phenylpropionic acid transporter